jgi:hypothetical protein
MMKQTPYTSRAVKINLSVEVQEYVSINDNRSKPMTAPARCSLLLRRSVDLLGK